MPSFSKPINQNLLDWETHEHWKTQICKFFANEEKQIHLYAKIKGLIEPNQIILSDKLLEDYLGVKAFHVKQIKELISEARKKRPRQGNQIPPIISRRTGNALRRTTHTVPFKPNPVTRPATTSASRNGSELGRYLKRLSATSTSVSTSTQTDFTPPATTTASSSSGTRDSATQTVIEEDGSGFKMKEDFYNVIKTANPGCLNNRPIEVRDAATYLSRYIIKNKQHLFDPRNIMIAIVENDPLGDVFKVRAFHRDQAKHYIREQLIPFSMGARCSNCGADPVSPGSTPQIGLRRSDARDVTEKNCREDVRNNGPGNMREQSTGI